MDFAEIVLAELAKRGMNVNQAEVMANLPQGFIRGVVREDEKRAIPSIKKAEQIAAALGLDFYIGPPRDTGPALVTEIAGDDFAAIPRYDAQLAAGNGVANHADLPAGIIAFRRDWLDRANISPGHAMVLGVRGDSMAPTLSDGDLVLIDRRRQMPRDRRIYALIGPDGEARVKRVERLPDTLLLHSDNAGWPTELIPATDANRIRILGEVVWWGHTVRD